MIVKNLVANLKTGLAKFQRFNDLGETLRPTSRLRQTMTIPASFSIRSPESSVLGFRFNMEVINYGRVRIRLESLAFDSLLP
jgi:hypothetical protein